MSKSKVCLILSAFIYGFAPILAKFAYKSGANGITLTFLRTFLMLPLLFFIMIFRKVSFKLTKKRAYRYNSTWCGGWLIFNDFTLCRI